MSVHVWKLRFLVDWSGLVEGHITNIGIPINSFVKCSFDDFLLRFKIFFRGSLQTSLLRILGELAGEGYFTMTVFGVSDM